MSLDFLSDTSGRKGGFMRKYIFFLLAIVSLNVAAFQSVIAQDAVPAQQDAVLPADVLDPPPLPKLDKGDWASKKTIFSEALSVEDADGNDLDQSFDLSGTAYTAHIDTPHKEGEDGEENPLYAVTSSYEQALGAKSFDTLVRLTGTPYFVMGAAEDNEDGGVYGQSVVAQGQLRFIAVSDSKNTVEIFVSDEVPLPELIQKIEAKDKTKTSGPKK